MDQIDTFHFTMLPEGRWAQRAERWTYTGPCILEIRILVGEHGAIQIVRQRVRRVSFTFPAGGPSPDAPTFSSSTFPQSDDPTASPSTFDAEAFAQSLRRDVPHVDGVESSRVREFPEVELLPVADPSALEALYLLHPEVAAAEDIVADGVEVFEEGIAPIPVEEIMHDAPFVEPIPAVPINVYYPSDDEEEEDPVEDEDIPLGGDEDEEEPEEEPMEFPEVGEDFIELNDLAESVELGGDYPMSSVTEYTPGTPPSSLYEFYRDEAVDDDLVSTASWEG